MLICRDFIYIHLPKTGGVFASTVLLDLYQRKISSNLCCAARSGRTQGQ